MKLETLVEKLAEVEILDYGFNQQTLSIRLECFEDSECYEVLIPTNIVEVNIKNEFLGNSALTTGIFHIHKLSDELDVVNNIYVPPSDFGKLMQCKRKGLSLAYGLKADDKYKLITLQGSSLILATICINFDDIKHHVITHEP